MRLLIIAILSVFTLPARAEEKPPVCQNVEGVIDQIDCYGQELNVADANLNATWRRVIAEHPSGGVKEEHTKDIRAAQRAWIAFRDMDCEAKSKIGIPKYWELNRVVCLYEMTKARTADLKEVYLF